MRQSYKSRDALYRTLVQDPDKEHIGKVMKRAVVRMIQLWIYYTLEMMKVGEVLWWVGNRMTLILG